MSSSLLLFWTSSSSMIEIISIVVINLFIINIRIWLIKNYFGMKEFWRYFLISLVTWLMGVWALFGFNMLIDVLDIKSLTSSYQLLSSSTIILFVILFHAIVSIVYILITDKNFAELQYILLIRGITMIVVTIWFNIISWGFAVTYYLFVALSEEYLKSLGWYIWFEKYKLTPSDIIVFCLISSLWFACIENIIHLWSQITQLFTIHVLSNTSIIVTKGIVSTMMHLFFTSFFAMLYFNYQNYNKKTTMIILVGILIGVGTHRWYDLILYYGYRQIIILYMIVWYFWMTYILYHSDRLYIDPSEMNNLTQIHKQKSI